MKKFVCILPAVCLLVLLSGCTHYPAQAADGTVWNENWATLGSVLGVEEPGNGFSILENNAILIADDLFYATWVTGSPVPYTNEDGDEVDLYEAHLYLLLCGCADAANAQLALEEWTARQEDTYTVKEIRTETCNGQEYLFLLYECGSDTNPYSRGVSAFTTYGNYAVSAELTCRESFTGDELSILTDFLEGCHYNAELN